MQIECVAIAAETFYDPDDWGARIWMHRFLDRRQMDFWVQGAHANSKAIID